MDSGNKLDDDIALTKLMELMKLIDQLKGMNEDKAKIKPTKRSKKSRQAKQSVSTETVNSIIESILDSVTNIMEPADTVSESTNKLPRMRGGALEDDMEAREETDRHLASIAILSAKYAGYKINLSHMVPNNASGDCAFESCLDQVNATRKEDFKDFGAGRFEDPSSLRRVVVDDLKENSKAMEWCAFNGSQDEYKKELDTLYKDGTWTRAVADLVIPGIAFTLKKNILIYKTKPMLDRAPIMVVRASDLGGEADTDVPIVLCYSGNHYEGLVPFDEDNTMLTVALVEWYLSGTYNITVDEIPVFNDALSGTKRKTSADAIAGPSGTKRKAKQPPTPKNKSTAPKKASITPTKTPAVQDVQKSPVQSPGKTKEQQTRALATERKRKQRLDPAYREKEAANDAKYKAEKRSSDPAYREKEAEKDAENKAKKRSSDPAYGGNDPQQQRDSYKEPERRSKRLQQMHDYDKDHYNEPEVRAKRVKQMAKINEKRASIDHDTGLDVKCCCCLEFKSRQACTYNA
ncbi:MAG: hypothetical protein NZ837_10460, partial [Gammaproteobacteria bacterium]|nr:hypothetical protein [Gammaproteobacteria bacterium]